MAIFIAVSSTGSCAKAVSDAAERAQKTNQSVVPADTPTTTQKTPVQVAVPPTETEKPASPSLSAEQWTSAANAVRQGDVQVRITGVRVGTVEVKDMFGASKVSKEALLSITLEINNLSIGRKLDFRTWRGADFSFGEDFASLTDDYDNTYKRISLGASSVPVGGVDCESIYPGKSITDVLVYEVPVDTVKWLRLKIPARNFNGEGVLRFEIPASMIQ